MSTQGNGGTIDSTGTLGNVDPNAGLNSLNAGLTGPGAGTMPNGFSGSGSNYVPDNSGVSAGALNGNTSFSMPSNSTGQLNSQALSTALAQGAKVASPTSNGNASRPAQSGHVSMHQVQFATPIQNFAGSAGGSQVGNSLLQLLAKYRPGGA